MKLISSLLFPSIIQKLQGFSFCEALIKIKNYRSIFSSDRLNFAKQYASLFSPKFSLHEIHSFSRRKIKIPPNFSIHSINVFSFHDSHLQLLTTKNIIL
ncbi:MAG: hypothetical protein F6K23_24535 [Okeania sp. SIO2C9]|uniref:hypothetical protein n=1 Tax=Okeania sp. SIO2C9 TaxID=2607791 RepID=UPI0013C0C6B8|nr:hypothetical protein [Okeania sp. SIO2C9]NEQ75921.1 hypothetical protein [Okeania sp. SIO2C9]